MKITIKVTKEVLKRSSKCGITNRTTNCAIALAVRELLPDASVNYGGIQVPNCDCFISLPVEALLFINRFDFFSPEQRESMGVITFQINVPDKYIERTIGISEAHEILKRSETLELAN